MEDNALTREVYELINSRGEIFLTSAVVGGTYAIRVVSANPKAEAYREYSVRHLSTDKEARGGESGGKKTPDVPFNPGGAAANEIQGWQHHSGAFSGTEFWRIWMVPWHGLGSTKTAHSAGPF